MTNNIVIKINGDAYEFTPVNYAVYLTLLDDLQSILLPQAPQFGTVEYVKYLNNLNELKTHCNLLSKKILDAISEANKQSRR